jgi:predicted metal-dependent peptidase
MKDAISKTNGQVPSIINQILEIQNTTPKVSWSRELKKIIGNNQANRIYTSKRPNRRQPSRLELKGKKKDTTFTLVCIVDISGSMHDECITSGLSELHQICNITNSDINLIQVDTEVHGLESFNKNTKVFTRKANGGTELYPAIEYIYDNKIEYDALLMITDGYIENLSTWNKPPKEKIIFLTTGKDIPGINNFRQYSQFNILDI